MSPWVIVPAAPLSLLQAGAWLAALCRRELSLTALAVLAALVLSGASWVLVRAQARPRPQPAEPVSPSGS